MSPMKAVMLTAAPTGMLNIIRTTYAGASAAAPVVMPLAAAAAATVVLADFIARSWSRRKSGTKKLAIKRILIEDSNINEDDDIFNILTEIIFKFGVEDWACFSDFTAAKPSIIREVRNAILDKFHERIKTKMFPEFEGTNWAGFLNSSDAKWLIVREFRNRILEKLLERFESEYEEKDSAVCSNSTAEKSSNGEEFIFTDPTVQDLLYFIRRRDVGNGTLDKFKEKLKTREVRNGSLDKFQEWIKTRIEDADYAYLEWRLLIAKFQIGILLERIKTKGVGNGIWYELIETIKTMDENFYVDSLYMKVRGLRNTYFKSESEEKICAVGSKSSAKKSLDNRRELRIANLELRDILERIKTKFSKSEEKSPENSPAEKSLNKEEIKAVKLRFVSLEEFLGSEYEEKDSAVCFNSSAEKSSNEWDFRFPIVKIVSLQEILGTIFDESEEKTLADSSDSPVEKSSNNESEQKDLAGGSTSSAQKSSNDAYGEDTVPSSYSSTCLDDLSGDSESNSDSTSYASSSEEEYSEDTSLESRLEEVVRLIRDGSGDIVALTAELIDLIQRLIERGYRVTRRYDSARRSVSLQIDSPRDDWSLSFDSDFLRMLDLESIMRAKKPKKRCGKVKSKGDCMYKKGYIIYAIRCKRCGAYYVGQTSREHMRLCREHPHALANDDKQLCKHRSKAHPECTMEFDDLFEIIILYECDEDHQERLRDFEIFWQWLLEALEIVGGMSKH